MTELRLPTDKQRTRSHPNPQHRALPTLTSADGTSRASSTTGPPQGVCFSATCLCEAVAEQGDERELQRADWSDATAGELSPPDGVGIVRHESGDDGQHGDRWYAATLERTTVRPSE